VSIGRGSITPRTKIVRDAQRSENLADRAPLVALEICDLHDAGEDPVPVLGRVFAGVLLGNEPLALIELVLAYVPWRDWSIGRRARLRVTLAARAFEAGLDVWELTELGQVVPDLGYLLHGTDLDGLARLRLLWTLRDNRPWRRCGPASTAFELAAYPTTENRLAAVADVLLEQPLVGAGADGRTTHLLITGRGLVFRGAAMHVSESIAVHLRPAGRGYELQFGSARFRFENDPSALADKLTEWSNYLFGEFLPQTDSAVGRPDGAMLERLLRTKTLVCPECGGLFRGRRPK
jgi:hypothetical protein